MVLEMVFHVPFNHLMLLLAPENFTETVSAVTTMKSLDFSLSLIVLLKIKMFSFTARNVIFHHHNYIQGDSGGICNTLGSDSVCDSKQKRSYEHGSDFERLPRYGKKKIRTILLARTVIT
jgi:hypothetical protein